MTDFELFLFSVDPHFIRAAVAAGVNGVVVDWESEDKSRRQSGYDTEINRHTVADLERVRHVTDRTVLCRINNSPHRLDRETEAAIARGADEILLPMVRWVEEVERLLDRVRNRCGVGILIETPDAVATCAGFQRLPLTRVYVGLNDLSIGLQYHHLFEALQDGTLDAVRRKISAPFGWGGLTRPERGRPVPCRLLIGEMARLRCQFSFLRRSFHADVPEADLRHAVGDIRDRLRAAAMREPAQIERERQELCSVLAALGPDAWPRCTREP